MRCFQDRSGIRVVVTFSVLGLGLLPCKSVAEFESEPTATVNVSQVHRLPLKPTDHVRQHNRHDRLPRQPQTFLTHFDPNLH